MSTLPPLASLLEFSSRVGQPLTEEDPDGKRAAAALADASALVRAEAGQSWVDEAGELADVPPEITTVVLQAARRDWRNLEGYTSETIDDYTWRRDGDQAAGTGVYLTDAEIAICRRYRPGGAGGISGLWTLGMTRGNGGGQDTVYVPVAGGGEPLPWLAYGDPT